MNPRICAFATLILLAAAAVTPAQERASDDRLRDIVYLSWIANFNNSECVRCHYVGPTLAERDSGRVGTFGAFCRRTEMQFWIKNDKHTIARARIEPFLPRRSLESLKLSLQQQVDLASGGQAAFQFSDDDVRAIWQQDSNRLSAIICSRLWPTEVIPAETSVEGANEAAGYGKERDDEEENDGQEIAAPSRSSDASPENDSGLGDFEKFQLTESGYAKFRGKCLTCHGGYHVGEEGVFAPTLTRSSQLGIDCLHCHNREENLDAPWITRHTRAGTAWRLTSPAEKEQAGMRDLVNLVNQANLCLDCHVGNAEKGMVVTHDMYVAGHPPLPPFELQTFCEQMPQHWQTPGELYQSLTQANDATRDDYFRMNYPVLQNEKISASEFFWATRKVLVGATVTEQRNVQQLLRSTSQQELDYAYYDCSGCHHELAIPSYRQDRADGLAPGRPRPPEWSAALFQAALNRTSSPFLSAFDSVPFGDSQAIEERGREYSIELQDTASDLLERSVSAETAQGLLANVLSIPNDRPDLVVTYDAARQLIWAVRGVQRELAARHAFPQEISKNFDVLDDPVATSVLISLPSGRHQTIFPDRLAEDLQRRSEFSPARLRQQFRTLRSTLPFDSPVPQP